MWAEIQAFAGWAGLLSVVLVLALVERMRRVFASREELEDETEKREIADRHRDERVHHLTELVQQYIGKIDLLRERMTEQDRERERDVSALREEVRTGFARILERLGDHPQRRD